MASFLKSSHARFHLSHAFPPFVAQNDVEVARNVPATNMARAEPTPATNPSAVAVDDAEVKRVQEKCRRLQAEVNKLTEENRQLKVRRESCS